MIGCVAAKTAGRYCQVGIVIVESPAVISRIAADGAVAEIRTSGAGSIVTVNINGPATTVICGIAYKIGPRNGGNYCSLKRYGASVTSCNVTGKGAVRNSKIAYTRIA